MMDKEHEVKGLLLSIVVSNQCNWLHMLHKVSIYHTFNQLPSMLFPRRKNCIFGYSVKHITALNDLSFFKYSFVKFLIENSIKKSTFLWGIEFLEVILSFKDKWQSLEFILNMDSHSHLLCFEIEDSITEEDQYKTGFFRVIRLWEYLVINESSTRVKLKKSK